MNPQKPEKGRAPDSAESDVDSLLRNVAHASTQDLGLETLAELQSPPSRPLPEVGDLIGGRYELKELLGKGGMGAVYAARHRGTDREVAIKVLLPSERGDRSASARLLRFVREAKAAGRIRHPNVVDVYDVEHDAQMPYIVMERLFGESLWQRMSRGPLPREEAVRILVAAMCGVSEAHRQGVIHRDLKPDNIFLARVAGHEAPIPKVLDFGVSRVMSRDGTEGRPTTLTRAGSILGTPSYMPLEQLRGRTDVDARADVYALGVILYEALCGTRPYEAHNDHDLVIRMATEAPTPLLARSEKMDPSLAAIVDRALAREPDDRFADVESFKNALERWLSGDRSLPSAHVNAAPSKRRALWIVGVTLLALASALWYGANARTQQHPSEAASKAKPTSHTLPSASLTPTATPSTSNVPQPSSTEEAAPRPEIKAPDVPSNHARATEPKPKRPRPDRGKPAAETPLTSDPSTTLKPEDF